MAPMRAKFLEYDIVLAFISFQTNFIVGVSVPVMFGSMPAVNRPKAPPRANPKMKENLFWVYPEHLISASHTFLL